GPVPIGSDSSLDAGQVVGDRVGEQHLASPDALGEEAALLNLVLALLVDLEREGLGADLLAVLAALLVVVPDPPDPRALRALEDAALPASATCGPSALVASVHVRSPRTARTRGRRAPSRSPRGSWPGRPSLDALCARSPRDTAPSAPRRPSS